MTGQSSAPVEAAPLSEAERSELEQSIRRNLIRNVGLIEKRDPQSEPYDFEM